MIVIFLSINIETVKHPSMHPVSESDQLTVMHLICGKLLLINSYFSNWWAPVYHQICFKTAGLSQSNKVTAQTVETEHFNLWLQWSPALMMLTSRLFVVCVFVYMCPSVYVKSTFPSAFMP